MEQKKNRKARRNMPFVILGILVIILIVVIIFINQSNAKKEKQEEIEASIEASKEAANKKSLIDFDIEDLVKVTVVNPKESLSFLYDGKIFSYADNKNLAMNQSKVKFIFNAATSIRSNALIATNLDDTANYGLDKPERKVVMEKKDGEIVTINIGVYFDTYYYVNIEGDQNIYTITTLGSELDKVIFDYIEVDELPTLTVETLLDVMYEDKDKTIEAKYFEKGLPERDLSGTQLWFFKSPEDKYYYMEDAARKAYFEKIVALAFSECVDFDLDDEKLAKYGLDDPTASLVVNYFTSEKSEVETGEMETAADGSTKPVTEEKTTMVYHDYKLLIGNSNEAGDYYAKLEKSDQVVILKKDDVEFFLNELHSTYLMSLYPLMARITNVDWLELEIGDKKWEMKIVDTGKKDEEGALIYDYFINEEEIEKLVFSQLYQAIIGIDGDRPIKEADALKIEDEEDTIFIKIHGTDDHLVTATLREFNESYYVMTVEDELLLYVTRKEVESLINQFAKSYEDIQAELDAKGK